MTGFHIMAFYVKTWQIFDKRAKTQLIHVHITRNQMKRFLLAFHGRSLICATMVKAKNLFSSGPLNIT